MKSIRVGFQRNDPENGAGRQLNECIVLFLEADANFQLADIQATQ